MKPSTIKKYLLAAGVPSELHDQAISCISLAKERAKGLVWIKWKTRLFHTKMVSEIIPWEAERLIDVKPELAYMDIAPMINITAHGDNAPWVMTPEGGRPFPGQWLDPNDKSAIEANYWCKDEHPRSKKSRKLWYQRNAGEYVAWERGVPCKDFKKGVVKVWEDNDVRVLNWGDAWQIKALKHLLGPLKLKIDIGFEIDNIWVESNDEQSWYPIPGYDLRAPVVWYVLPSL